MKTVRYCCTFLVTLALLAAASCFAADGQRVLRIADRREIDFNQLITDSVGTRYIFLAENHDDSRHHAAQLDFIKGLQQRGLPLAIGLEMFTAASQAKLDQWVAGRLSLAEFRELYARNWEVAWEYYREIFIYARDKRIKLIGLNLPQEISRKVARQGFAALTPQERRQLPAEITCNVGPLYMAFIRQAYANHAMSSKDFSHFCEAQLLWNRTMAHRLQDFTAKNPRHTVVVLAGIGHALKKGMPDEISADTTLYRVVLPEFRGLNRRNLTSQDADYLILLDADSGN